MFDTDKSEILRMWLVNELEKIIEKFTDGCAMAGITIFEANMKLFGTMLDLGLACYVSNENMIEAIDRDKLLGLITNHVDDRLHLFEESQNEDEDDIPIQ